MPAKIFLFILCLFSLNLISQSDEFFLNLKRSDNYKRNIELLDSAIKSNTTKDPATICKINDLLIKNYIALNEFDKALVFSQKNRVFAFENKLPFYEASSIKNIGNIYYFLNQREKCRAYWLKSIEPAIKSNNYEVLKSVYNNLAALAIEETHNYIKAEEYLLLSIKYGKLSASPLDAQLGTNYRLLASNYEALKQYNKADSAFKISMEEYLKCNDTVGYYNAAIFLAHLHNSLGLFGKALKEVDSVINYAIAHKARLTEQTARAQKIEILLNLNDYQTAYNEQRIVSQMILEDQTNDLHRQIAEAESKFKLEEFQMKQKQIEQEERTRWILIVCGVVVFSLILLFFLQQRWARKENQLRIEKLKAVYETEEKERARIARDLHDNMGAFTTSLIYQIDQLIEKDTSHDLLLLRKPAENIMSTLRETIWILKYKEITVSSFFEKTTDYFYRTFSQNNKIQISVNSSDNSSEQKISAGTYLNLHRIIQELAQNIIKHANAKSVVINFNFNSKIEIIIEDDGVGFDFNSGNLYSGINNIFHRASEIGFVITYTSKKGSGCKVLISEL